MMRVEKLLISLLLIQTLKAITACPESDPLNQVYCSCNQKKFSLAGKCIVPDRFCSMSFLTDIYTSQSPVNGKYMLWDSTIAPFWSQKFQTAKKTATPPNPLPSLLNEYKFDQMSSDQKRGWVQAYYFYFSLKIFIQSLSVSDQNSLLFDAVTLATTFQNMNYIDIWNSILKFAIQKFQINWNLQQFTLLVDRNVKSYMPCHECLDTYGPLQTQNSTICLKCPPNCLACSDGALVCDSCISRFWLNSSYCQQCTVYGCLECQSDGTCLVCESGKVLYQGSCLPCSQNCVSCQQGNPQNCLQCYNLIYSSRPTDLGVCALCDQRQCLNCDPEYPSLCKICGAGYFTDHSYHCQKCPANCIGCTKNQCYSCDYGYGIVNKTCEPCKMNNCLRCDYGIQTCNYCRLPYFYLNSTTNNCEIADLTIARCRPGCSTCYDDNQLCFTCSQRYYIDRKYCKKCIPGCLNCITNDSCLQCDLGYTKVDKICVACPQNCKICASPSICQTCFQRYNFNDKKQCVIAQNTKCMFFDSQSNNCVMCKPGYTLTSKNDCVRCLTGSIWSCSPTNISQVQKNRFQLGAWYFNEYNLGREGCYLQLNNQCIEPDSRYKIVQINGTYYAQYKCLYPCTTCNYSELTQCFSCESGYSLTNGRCIPMNSCNPNCKSCPHGSQRSLISNNCELCQLQNCASCSNKLCLECQEGYYLEDLICKRCPSKCKSCYNSLVCNQCSRGYVKPAQWTSLEGKGDCVVCNPNCLTCRFEESICTSCSDKMILIDNRCISMTQINFEYTLNMTPSQFMNKTLYQKLLVQIAKQNGFDPDKIFLTDITETNQNGPVIIKGIIPVDSGEQGNKTIDSLNFHKLSDLKVINSSFSLNQIKQNPCPTCVTDPPGGKIKAIMTGLEMGEYLVPWIWVVCGSILAIIIILTILFAIYRYRVKKRENEEQEMYKQRARQSDSDNMKSQKYIIQQQPQII